MLAREGVKTTPNAAFEQVNAATVNVFLKKFEGTTCKSGLFLCILETILKKAHNMKRTFVLITTVLATFILSNKAMAQSDELINVYRWLDKVNNNYVTVSEDEYQDGQLINWGWKNKTLIFVAYRNPGPNRVAVYSWFNPVTKDYISVAEDEYTDDQMIKSGYASKKIQFYAPTRRGPNTLAIYRWRRGTDWVTIPEEGDTDAYIKKGYRRKSFQFFGIARSVDAAIYEQL